MSDYSETIAYFLKRLDCLETEINYWDSEEEDLRHYAGASRYEEEYRHLLVAVQVITRVQGEKK